MNRLQDIRNEKDLTQKEISKIINKSREIYSQYENENYQMSIKNLKILSHFYNTSLDYIFYRTDKRESYSPSIIENNTNKHNRLEDLRKNLNKTQKELALELKIPLSTYRQYEKSKRSLNIIVLNIFANYFKTSIDYIVYNTDNITPYSKSKVDLKAKEKEKNNFTSK